MSVLAGYAVGLANLFLAVRYPVPLYTLYLREDSLLPLRAALALAPQLQAAQANRMEDVYKTIIRPDNVADALRGHFAPEFLYHNLSEQHLLCSLPVLARAKIHSKLDGQHLQRALRAIHDRLGYAFFESAIRACVGKTQVSQKGTILDCVALICYSFPDDILSLAQRYGDLMIRLHGALPFLSMLHDWCNHQAHVSREALVEAFDSPLTRAAAMILDHPKLSPIPSQEAVEAAFDALSLAERARLLLTSYFYNEHASSVERKLRLLGFDPSIQRAVCTSSDEKNANSDELLLRCLLHIPDPNSVHVVLETAYKQSEFTQYLLETLADKDLLSDETRTSLARALINIPGVLHDLVRHIVISNNTWRIARNLPDASLRAALEARLAWQKETYNLSERCVNAVKNLIINRFGVLLRRLKNAANIAAVYDAMLQDHAWLETVDETVAKILGAHSLPIMDTMYSISSEPEQSI